MPAPVKTSPAALGNVRNFVNVLREISFEEVRDQAETMPQVLVLGASAAAARELGLALTGGAGELAITARDLATPPTDLDRFDAIVVSDPLQTGLARTLRDRQMAANGVSTVVSPEGPDPADPATLEALRVTIVRLNPDRAPAFGRAFPIFRPAAVKTVVNETAMANAQFALLSNIPALLPIVGGIAAASADFIVLTKNQLMMMYKLGAIYDRDLSDQFAIIQELVPVVGAGFVWRSVARGAASFLPFAAGTLPKVGVAFVGTMIVGHAADYYYRTALRPSRQQLQAFREQATELLRRIPVPVLRNLPRGQWEDAIEAEGRVKPAGDATDIGNDHDQPSEAGNSTRQLGPVADSATRER